MPFPAALHQNQRTSTRVLDEIQTPTARMTFVDAPTRFARSRSYMMVAWPARSGRLAARRVEPRCPFARRSQLRVRWNGPMNLNPAAGLVPADPKRFAGLIERKYAPRAVRDIEYGYVESVAF